jgi:hypothetical protein
MPSFDGWTPLGSPEDKLIEQIAVCANEDGTIVVFALVGGDLWHISELQQSLTFSSWQNFGHPGKHALSKPLAADLQKDGRLKVFVSTEHGTTSRIQTKKNGPWAGWQDFFFTSENVDQSTNTAHAVAFAVGKEKNGNMNAFGVLPDGRVVRSWETDRWKNESHGWSWIESLAREPVAMESLAVGSNDDFRFEVFARGQGGHLWQTWQEKPYGSFAGWVDAGTPPGLSFVGAPSIALDANHQLEVVCIASDGQLWKKHQIAKNSTWTDWVSLQGELLAGVPKHRFYENAPVIASNGDGRMHVFGVGPDTSVWQRFQFAKLSDDRWTDWGSFNGEVVSQIAVGYERPVGESFNNMVVFIVGRGQLWFRFAGP